MLAIKGGKPVRTEPFPLQSTIGSKEKTAAMRPIYEKELSGYLGCAGDSFLGGREVQALEAKICEKFNAGHAIPFNSATNALQIACKALNLQKGDEVIVTPWSMSCSTTAPLLWGAVPVFADIEEDHYCLDPESVEEKITDKTKAIIAVDLFGCPYSFELEKLARKHNLFVIEDAAQAIGAQRDFQYAGLLGFFGILSFNQHKHIHAGEGGMILASKDVPTGSKICRLFMNHGEAVTEDFIAFGFNMRMTEIQAAILQEQLKKLDGIILTRQKNACRLAELLGQIPAIETPTVREGCSHVYYTAPFKWKKEKADGLHRDVFINAVLAELPGVQKSFTSNETTPPIQNGYVDPLYKLPLFQNIGYENVSLPVVERLQYEEVFLVNMVAPPTDWDDLNDVAKAFFKVWENRKEL